MMTVFRHSWPNVSAGTAQAISPAMNNKLRPMETNPVAMVILACGMPMVETPMTTTMR